MNKSNKRKKISESEIPEDFFSIKFKPISKETQKRLEEAAERANENIRRNNLVYASSSLHAKKYPVTSNLKKTTYEEKSNSSSNIYVYVGSYKINNNKNIEHPNDFLTSFDSSNADYRLYIKIGMINQERKIAISEQMAFERENIVLYPPKEADKIAYFNEVRKMYFNTLIEYGQEKAIETILNFQSSFSHQTLSLQELVENINGEDDEDFELELHPQRQKLELFNKRV